MPIKIKGFPQIENKKILFLAETKFQIINCINIATHTLNCQKEIYITPLYNESRELAEKVSKLNLFSKVKILNADKANKIVKLYRYFIIKKYLCGIFEKLDYDMIFFASRTITAKLLYAYVKKYMPHVHMVSYDEGIGTYTSEMEYSTNKFERMIHKLFFNSDGNFVTDKFLYMPSAYNGDGADISLFQIPKVDCNVKKMISYIFDLSDKAGINTRYIFLDFYSEVPYVKEIKKKLVQKYGNNLTVKKHPQIMSDFFEGAQLYPHTEIPFEAMVINDENIANRVLITFFSTAVITPMLLFDCYPELILLYPLIGRNDVDQVFRKMTERYDKSKIHIIHSIDELNALQI